MPYFPAGRLSVGSRVDIQLEESPKKRLAPKPSTAKKKSPPADAGAAPKLTPALVHIDEQILVVEKPPGLTTMLHAEEAAEFGTRAKRFLPPTLADLLPKLIKENKRNIFNGNN